MFIRRLACRQCNVTCNVIRPPSDESPANLRPWLTIDTLHHLGILRRPVSSAFSVFKTVITMMPIFSCPQLMFLFLALLVPLQILASVFPAQIPLAASTEPLDLWLARQNLYALDGILNNLGADGAKSIGASPGSVVASPSKADPDCTSLSLFLAFLR